MTSYQWLESVVGWAANVGQIVTIAFALWVFWRAKRRFERVREGMARTKGCHGAIVIGIGGSIKGQVEPVVTQLKVDNPGIEDIAYTDEIVRRGHLSPNQQVAVLPEVLERKQQLTDLGVTHVYIFYKGPIALAMGIGALLDNWVPVTVFQFDGGTYVPILSLGKGAILNFRTEVLVEGETALLEQIMPQENNSATSSQTTS